MSIAGVLDADSDSSWEWDISCAGFICFSSIQVELSCLYIHAGSPNITNLTYNDQTRTLNCTSTGGPATTVTWRRDGVVITLNATYQQTKSLIDPVTGTYKTMLIIDLSLDLNIVGTYNCTVENVRGESSETVIVPGETLLLYSRLV